MGKVNVVLNIMALMVSLVLTYIFSGNLRLMIEVLNYRNTIEEWKIVLPLILFTGLFMFVSYATSKNLLFLVKNKPTVANGNKRSGDEWKSQL